MQRRLYGFALVLLSLPALAEAVCPLVPPPDPSKSVDRAFYVCHADRAYRTSTGEWKALAGGSTIRVPHGKTEVIVVDTNTALYDFLLSSEPVDSPEAQQLNAFLKAFGPYVIEVAQVAITLRAEGVSKPDEKAKSLKDALDRLNFAIDEHLRKHRLQVLRAYGTTTAADLSAAAADICASEAKCRTLFADSIETLLEAYEAVHAAIPNGQADLPTARKALDEAGEVLQQVRTLERLVLAGLAAKSFWRSPPFPVTLEKGRKVTLKIVPKPIAALAARGDLPAVDTAFTLQPDWAIRPALGLSLLYAEDAVFPELGTAKRTTTGDDGEEVEAFEIVEGDLEDDRFTYGLTLGLTHRALCRADGRRCPWLDLTLNPSDDVRALGAGLSWNWGRLKLGAGALWTKHEVLRDGLRVGDLLAAEGDLETRDSYGKPELYVLFSVIGWQPFVPE